ncbi:beta-N-acetylhexosaminidase [Georgenia satyanarayanai]|uniref:beta-N-acetylhexosaminidase n=1 Tax=Georgenia satyanarayanai TaxID=860221 RepID=A0A2Y9AIU0_9MICO|nr:glycoside hydrolase family 3 protein [Georgenia satyanarayanai]PYF99376.1 beta-N-acetylhexosaminidase [Georgenia satyanarayanai]SSA43188.1 beta-N-acetylhexosaminidase [Georgenia satyanarayanai]
MTLSRTVLGAALAALALLAPAAHAAAPGTTAGTGTAAQVAEMSEEELIGQMVWAHVYGSSADDTSMAAENRTRYGVDTPAQVVEKYGLGGVLYFAWAGNTESPEQVAELSAGLQEAADRSSGVPLAITVDQEGGEVSRIGEPATALPGGMALGATFDAGLARAQGELLGSELAAMGVNVDWAPVADLNTNPANPVIGLRSLGADPAHVAELTAAQVEGLQSQHVAAGAKHFPGHGDTDVDSHTGLPVVAGDPEVLDAHLEPFRAAISAGVDIIMSAHIVVESLDPDLPGTLSPRVLTDLLREELGYTGLVTTDALDMAALKQLPGNPLDDGDIAVLAIQAGSDILLDSPDVDATIAGIQEALASGELTRERLEESVTRILDWKAERGIGTPGPGLDVVGSEEHRATAQTISERALTVLRDEPDLSLPLDPEADVLVVGAGSAWPERLSPLLEDEGLTVTKLLESGDSPSAGYRSAAVRAAAQEDVGAVVAAVDDLRANAAQRALLEELAAGAAPVLAVLAGAPYDLAAVPADIDGVVASYGAATVNFRGAAAVLSGRELPTGRLPVEVTAQDGTVLAEVGFGLRRTEEVTPTDVTFTDLAGTEADTVEIPRSTGVVYLVDGAPADPGSHPATGTVVVTVEPDPPSAYHLADDATTRWEHTFDATSPAATPDREDDDATTPWVVVAAGLVVVVVVTGGIVLRRRRRSDT